MYIVYLLVLPALSSPSINTRSSRVPNSFPFKRESNDPILVFLVAHSAFRSRSVRAYRLKERRDTQSLQIGNVQVLLGTPTLAQAYHLSASIQQHSLRVCVPYNPVQPPQA